MSKGRDIVTKHVRKEISKKKTVHIYVCTIALIWTIAQLFTGAERFLRYRKLVCPAKCVANGTAQRGRAGWVAVTQAKISAVSAGREHMGDGAT